MRRFKEQGVFNQGKESKPVYDVDNEGNTPQGLEVEERNSAEETLNIDRTLNRKRKRETQEKRKFKLDFITNKDGLNILAKEEYDVYKKILSLISEITCSKDLSWRQKYTSRMSHGSLKTSAINMAVVSQDSYKNIFSGYEDLDDKEEEIFNDLKNNKQIVNEVRSAFGESTIEAVLKKAIRTSNNTILNKFIIENDFSSGV